MNASTTNPLLTKPQPPAASFLSVLTSTAGQGGAGTGSVPFMAAKQSNNEAASGSQQTATDASGQATVRSNAMPAGAAAVTSGNQVTTARDEAEPTVAPSLHGTSRAATTNNKDTKVQSAVDVVAGRVAPPALTAPTAQPVAAASIPSLGTKTDGPQSDDGASCSVTMAPADGAAESRGANPVSADAKCVETAAKVTGQPATDFSSISATDADGIANSSGTASDSANAIPFGNASGAQTDGATVTEAQRTALIAEIPNAIALPSFQLANSATPAAPGKAVPSANGTVSSDASQAATPDKNHATGSTSGATSGGTSSATPAGPAVQHAQADAVQTPQSAAKGADAIPMPMASHEATVVRHESTTEAPRLADAARADAAAAGENTEGAASVGINTARLIQTMSQTEMHVGLRSAEFGDISIRTLVSQQQMFAQISVDHGDLGRAIAAGAPGLQARLGDDFGVHAAIEVSQGTASFSGERGYGQQQQGRSPVVLVQENSGGVSGEAEAAVMRAVAITGRESRLDIRA